MLVWEDEIWSRFVKELVIWTQPSGTGAQCESDFVFLSVSLSLSLCLCLQLYLPSSWPNFHSLLSESDTPNWQRASHTNDSIWRPYLLSNKCPCLWSWEPRCNTLNHIKFKFKSPHPTRWLPLPVYTIKFKIPYLYIIYLISMSAEIVLRG